MRYIDFYASYTYIRGMVPTELASEVGYLIHTRVVDVKCELAFEAISSRRKPFLQCTAWVGSVGFAFIGHFVTP